MKTSASMHNGDCCTSAYKSDEKSRTMYYNDNDLIQISQATYLQSRKLFHISCAETIEEHLMKTDDEFTLVELLKHGIIFVGFVLFWPIWLLIEILGPKMKSKYLLTEDYRQSFCPGHFLDYPTPMVGIGNVGDIDDLDLLISNGVGVNQHCLLFHAIESDQVDLVKYLLQKDVDLLFENIDHMTPLMYAVSLGKEEIVELLLEKDSSAINTGDSCYGRVPLAFCRTQKSLTIGMIKLLCTYGADINLAPDLLLCASRRTMDEHLVKFILQQKPNSAMINRTYTETHNAQQLGNSVLMYLAQKGMVQSVKEMLHLKVDVFKRNNDGLTALDLTQEALSGHNSHSMDSSGVRTEAQVFVLLKAAGLKESVPGIMETPQKEVDSLQALCRCVIRDYLLEINTGCHLFLTVPKLPLPSGGLGDYYRSYLLFYQYLDTR